MTRTQSNRSKSSKLIEHIAPDPGEWVQPIKQGYLLQCCDCGLVHRFDFRIVKNGRKHATVQGASYHVQLRAYRA